MKLFSYHQRQEIKQLIIESEVLNLTTKEAVIYIKSKSQLDVSQETIHSYKHQIKVSSLTRLKTLQHSRYAMLYEYFQRIDEIKTYQKELWATILRNPGNGFLKKHCISELHQLTITLTNLYEMLPEYSSTIASRSTAPTENDSSQEAERQEQRPGDQSQRIFA